MTWELLSLQDPINMMSMYLTAIHDSVMQLSMSIMMIMTYIIIISTYNKSENLLLLSSMFMEMFWTTSPMLALTSIASPSLELLYLNETPFTLPLITLKAIGHQWYWSYEYPEFLQSFESYMISNPETTRLLDVDNRVILPLNTPVQILCTSTDVIHSWTIPAMAIKIDAVPGRINQLNSMIMIPGIFYGQCSEICGMNHSFMPITLETTSPDNFITWVMMDPSL